MRRLLCTLMMTALISAAAMAPVSAVRADGRVSVTVDGQLLSMESPAFLDLAHGRVMVPVRALAEALGATVSWDDTNHAVLINTPAYPADAHPADAVPVFVNGQPLATDAPATVAGNLILVPVRAIAEALGANVAWSGETNSVRIMSPKGIAEEYRREAEQVKDVLNGVGMAPHMAADGAKEFTLVAAPHVWEPVQGVLVEAFAYNGQVPGPVIRVTEGDHVRITLVNKLSEPTTIHWHGLHLPNGMDGVPGVTQPVVQPGRSFTYEFTASHAGTFMYHSHVNEIHQVGQGLRGAFIVDPRESIAAEKYDHDYIMLLSGFHTIGALDDDEEDFFTMDGRSFPDTAPITVRKGETVRLRLINIDTTEFHTMHLHGMDFTVIAKDGHPAVNPQKMNTIAIGPGETYDIAFTADAVGTWAFHCHIMDHLMNAEEHGAMGGLVTLIKVED